MKVIADLQLHSKYSRAVSPRMDVDEIARWALKKGMGLMATGDWTHPLWLRELKAKLVEDGSGFLRLKESSETKISSLMNSSILKDSGSRQATTRSEILSSSDSRDVSPQFLLATEVSSIYSQGGKVRRIHNLIWAPTFATVDKVIAELNRRGCNLGSDGRPIIGLTSRDIAELVLSIDESCLIIPAHAWTPWFSLYGSKSGFDSVEECFGNYAKYIYAIETGLSSDPVMNWRIGDLSNRAILSFSDAHSGPKLGREATVFELSEMTYTSLRKAIIGSSETKISSLMNSSSLKDSGSRQTTTRSEILSSSDHSNKQPLAAKISSRSNSLVTNKISCTFEFYPEEGKYHYTGHRLCHVKQTPEETKKMGTVCHVCGKPLTVGVMHRVEDLAASNAASPSSNITAVQKVDANGVRWMYHPTDKSRPPYVNLVPLLEILAEVEHTVPTSLKVLGLYDKLTDTVGTEFTILLKSDIETIAKAAGVRVAEAVKKVRAGDIFIDPGFDGEFGKVKIWPVESDSITGKDSASNAGSKENREDNQGKKQMSLF